MVHDSRPAKLVYTDSTLSEQLKTQLEALLAGRSDFALGRVKEDCDFVLSIEAEQLKLLDKLQRPLVLDFDLNHIDYNRKGHKGKQEIIAKALGASKGVRKVLDLTAGLGQDSVFLTQIGFSVRALERNPLLYFLLQNAKDKSVREELSDLVFLNQDAKEYLSADSSLIELQQRLQAIDAIYFDPMYPHKKKSALPRQEMLIFRDMVGDDLDAMDVALLAKKALDFGPSRLVIKRPLQAEALLPNPIHSFEGKTVRYDLYSKG